MHDPASRCHPLHIACRYAAPVSDAVFVVYDPGQDIGYRFDSTVWMHRETCQIVFGVSLPKVFEEQKGPEIIQCPGCDAPPEPHTRTLSDKLGLDDFRHRPSLYFHVSSLSLIVHPEGI
jgi:hypothetical protein